MLFDLLVLIMRWWLIPGDSRAAGVGGVRGDEGAAALPGAGHQLLHRPPGKSAAAQLLHVDGAPRR